MSQHPRMRIRALSVFERIVYHCVCIDAHDPARPVLEVDAILRDGDADGPLLVTVADYKQMLGFDVADGVPARSCARAGRTEVHDGVEYLVVPRLGTRLARTRSPGDDVAFHAVHGAAEALEVRDRGVARVVRRRRARG